jgi:hypothetical protein
MEEVWSLSIAVDPLTERDPVISTDPVKVCLSINSSPNMFDPELYTILEDTISTTKDLAVIVSATKIEDAVIEFLTKKLSADDAVAEFDDDIAKSEFSAQLAVPKREPVIPSVTVKDPLIRTPLSLRYSPLESPTPSVIFLYTEVICPLSFVFNNDWYVSLILCPVNDAIFFFYVIPININILPSL